MKLRRKKSQVGSTHFHPTSFGGEKANRQKLKIGLSKEGTQTEIEVSPQMAKLHGVQLAGKIRTIDGQELPARLLHLMVRQTLPKTSEAEPEKMILASRTAEPDEFEFFRGEVEYAEEPFGIPAHYRADVSIVFINGRWQLIVKKIFWKDLQERATEGTTPGRTTKILEEVPMDQETKQERRTFSLLGNSGLKKTKGGECTGVLMESKKEIVEDMRKNNERHSTSILLPYFAEETFFLTTSSSTSSSFNGRRGRGSCEDTSSQFFDYNFLESNSQAYEDGGDVRSFGSGKDMQTSNQIDLLDAVRQVLRFGYNIFMPDEEQVQDTTRDAGAEEHARKVFLEELAMDLDTLVVVARDQDQRREIHRVRAQEKLGTILPILLEHFANDYVLRDHTYSEELRPLVARRQVQVKSRQIPPPSEAADSRTSAAPGAEFAFDVDFSVEVVADAFAILTPKLPEAFYRETKRDHNGEPRKPGYRLKKVREAVESCVKVVLAQVSRAATGEQLQLRQKGSGATSAGTSRNPEAPLVGALAQTRSSVDLWTSIMDYEPGTYMIPNGITLTKGLLSVFWHYLNMNGKAEVTIEAFANLNTREQKSQQVRARELLRLFALGPRREGKSPWVASTKRLFPDSSSPSPTPGTAAGQGAPPPRLSREQTSFTAVLYDSLRGLYAERAEKDQWYSNSSGAVEKKTKTPPSSEVVGGLGLGSAGGPRGQDMAASGSGSGGTAAGGAPTVRRARRKRRRRRVTTKGRRVRSKTR
ncbi:unnamed protein product [Amoebophrya sp. A120]|nr:unnamed protein product [Amoebophrya sp. A120]|eukprot:GSA120T00014072001.1